MLLDAYRRAPAQTGQRSTCPTCGDALLSKCGALVVPHWAHLARADCDPWAEPESPWHRRWKERFPSPGAKSVSAPIGPTSIGRMGSSSSSNIRRSRSMRSAPANSSIAASSGSSMRPPSATGSISARVTVTRRSAGSTVAAVWWRCVRRACSIWATACSKCAASITTGGPAAGATGTTAGKSSAPCGDRIGHVGETPEGSPHDGPDDLALLAIGQTVIILAWIAIHGACR